MSPPNQLTREELLEMAELEMLGALDEYEQTFFHRAMLNAPSAVQEEIRNLQASIAGDTSLLADGEPDESLKLNTLAAVAHAIDEENEQLAPLATIGGIHRGAMSGAASSSANFGQMYLWRAATFALAAGLLVCLFFLGRVVENNRILVEGQTNGLVMDQLIALGGVDVEDIMKRPHASRAIPATVDPVTRVAGQFSGTILFYEAPEPTRPDLPPGRDLVVVYVHGLASDLVGEFRVVATDDQNRRYDLGTVAKKPGYTAGVASLAHVGKILPNVGALASLKIEIIGADGTVLMATV